MALMNWTECDIAVTGHARRLAEADATAWMRPAPAGSSPQAFLVAVLIALGTRLRSATGGMRAHEHAAVSAERS